MNPSALILLLLSATAGAQALVGAESQAGNPLISSNAPMLLTNIQQVAAIGDEPLRRGSYEATVQGTIIYIPQQGMRLYFPFMALFAT